jgi:hypothetical protein
MFSYSRMTLLGSLLVVLAALDGCTASPAPKVPCESNLRPINPANLGHPLP